MRSLTCIGQEVSPLHLIKGMDQRDLIFSYANKTGRREDSRTAIILTLMPYGN